MGADVPGGGPLAREQALASATEDSEKSNPAGRGRLPLPGAIVLPQLDIDEMRDEHQSNWLGPTRVLPPDIGGTWAWTQEGRRVWRVTIRAPGAKALRVRFDDFNARGSVWLYGNEWSGPEIGPYRDGGPHREGGFWSEFVHSDTVTVEYVPDDVVPTSPRVPFRLTSLAQIVDDTFPGHHTQRKAGGPQARSLAGCHLDVSCYPGLQDRNSPSVARMYITTADGTRSCTGFLINPNYENSDRLLFLTAGHCIRTQQQALDASFLWNYQTEECYGNPNWRQWADQLAFTYGARLLVRRDDSSDDFTLLALDRAEVSAAIRWWAEGWTTSGVETGDQVSTVGHPDGSHKRAAIGLVVNQRWRNVSPSGFQSIRWQLGTSEPGSSGSPVFMGTGADRRVVGILTGGNGSSIEESTPWGRYCSPDLVSSFNRLDHVYETIEPYMQGEAEPTRAASASRGFVVTLGSTGTTITLVRADDGTFWMGGALVNSGETAVRTGNGNVYTLEMTVDDDGAVRWKAVYSAERVRVRLGRSGYTVELVRAEDRSWWMGRTQVRVNSLITGPRGTRYRLVMVGGRWAAREV